METKVWYLSKTLWANLLMVILSVIQSDLVMGLNILPPETLAMVIAAVNFLLRFLTSTPLTATKQ